jgi:hypothetical protein
MHLLGMAAEMVALHLLLFSAERAPASSTAGSALHCTLTRSRVPTDKVSPSRTASLAQRRRPRKTQVIDLPGNTGPTFALRFSTPLKHKSQETHHALRTSRYRRRGRFFKSRYGNYIGGEFVRPVKASTSPTPRR